MSNFVAIQNTAMPVVEYQGKRVVTFAMIDKVHGRPKGTAKRALNRPGFIGADSFKVYNLTTEPGFYNLIAKF